MVLVMVEFIKPTNRICGQWSSMMRVCTFMVGIEYDESYMQFDMLLLHPYKFVSSLQKWFGPHVFHSIHVSHVQFWISDAMVDNSRGVASHNAFSQRFLVAGMARLYEWFWSVFRVYSQHQPVDFHVEGVYTSSKKVVQCTTFGKHGMLLASFGPFSHQDVSPIEIAYFFK